MVTRVVAKQAKTTKSKTILLMQKKVQKNTYLSFWWKAKSFIWRKMLGEKVQATNTNFS